SRGWKRKCPRVRRSTTVRARMPCKPRKVSSAPVKLTDCRQAPNFGRARIGHGWERSGGGRCMELKMTELTSRLLAAACLSVMLTPLSLPLLAGESVPSESPVAESLPELGADIGSTSVSGLSSGAYMAGQIEVAHSKDIKGAGIVAGGPYACAETQASRQVPFWPSAVLQNAQQALNQCMQTTAGKPDPKALAK